MTTKIVKVENQHIDMEVIAEAASIIQKGGLVAFPTETVYGLGADALNPLAVKKIYEAKGRPSDNPLILHIATKDSIKEIACDISETAEMLMDAFWPGPLTLIFNKKEVVPYETSGGLSTVAVRMPKDEIARALIIAAQVPIAAPSANSSGKPSPTRASHVAFDLDGKIDIIIDGGSCEFGLESTILDLTESTPNLLRPGAITKEMIETLVGPIRVDGALLSETEKPKAPGMKYTHYSPNANVTIVSGELQAVVQKINELVDSFTGTSVGILATEQTKHFYDKGLVLVVGDRERPQTIASNLFKMLRKFDYMGVSEVYAEGFEENDMGLAIMNRLKKAASYKVITLD